MTFPERLKQLRTDAHMTQRQLAEKAGVANESVWSWENGRTDPSGFYLCCLADVFGCTTDYLLGRSEKKNAE